MKDAIKIATERAKAKRLAWVAAQFAKKKTPTQIAAVLGVTRQRVDQLLKEAGVKS